MRTTLDLDDRVLSAGRSRAARDGTSLGAAISALALEGLRHHDLSFTDGLPVFIEVEGHVITDDLVTQHRDE